MLFETNFYKFQMSTLPYFHNFVFSTTQYTYTCAFVLTRRIGLSSAYPKHLMNFIVFQFLFSLYIFAVLGITFWVSAFSVYYSLAHCTVL